MIYDYISLALGNLKHRGARSWLTMLGIFVGIAAVVSLISLGQGLERAITAQFATLSTDKLLIQNTQTSFGPPGSMSVKKLTEHDFQVIEKVNGVDKAVVRYIRVGKVEYNKIANFKYITSIPLDKDSADIVYKALNVKPESGRLLDAGETGKVFLGSDYKTNNGFDKDIRVSSIIAVQGKKFEVIGILDKASTFQINSVVFMSEKDLKDTFNIKDEIDVIVVQVSNPDEVEATARRIEQALRKDRNEKIGEEDFSVQTPISAINSVKTVLNIINLIVGGIAAISLLIGGVGVANTMFTSVLERTKEIGVMKSVGAKNKDILLIFLIESGLLGLVGGIVGAIIGLSLAFMAATFANSFFGNQLFTVAISSSLIIGSISLSLILGLISGLFPAYQASKLNPVDSLRK